MKVAVLGGTGFVGHYLTEKLLHHGHIPRLLTREDSPHLSKQTQPFEWIRGDIEDNKTLRRLLTGADAVIYNIGILREYPSSGITFEKFQYEWVARTVELAKDQQIKRFLLMSANGVELGLTAYQKTKLAAESILPGSGLDWTVFRPSVIFGNPHGRLEFVTMLKRDIIDSPLPAPLFYEGLIPNSPGGFQLSPVHVEDVAECFVSSLDKPETYNNIYTLGGPHNLTWKEILTIIANTLGRKKLMLPVPAVAPAMAAALLDRFPWFPISRDQIRMLVKGNVCSGEKIFKLCNIQPRSFNEESLRYIAPQNDKQQLL
ncbi:MAG: NAD(P)H-binding protein [Candidatus Thiodiazotropha sp.]|jgi:NADH dehydrogenase